MDSSRGTVELIRIHHERDGGIEKSVPMITDWHHEAWIFPSHSHMNNEFFLLLTT